MTLFFAHLLRPMPTLLAISALSLSACETNPDRDRPNNRGDRQERPARTSGTFIQPIALLFADMDSNRDRATSKAEMLAGVQAEWDRFDRQPSATVLASWSMKTLGSTDANPTFMSFDRDFNGVVAKAEFSARFEVLFGQYDKNTDDVLDRSELIIAFEAPIGRGQRGGGEAGGRGQGDRGGRGGGRQQR